MGILGAGCKLCLHGYDNQEERPADHRLPIGGQADPAEAVLEIQDVEDQPEQEHARERRADGADTAREERAADHDRRDGEELPADAFTRFAGRPIRRVASSLPPIASTVRPNDVKLRTTDPAR